LREVDKEDLEEAILGANDDDSVDGIIVYFPVFGGGQVGIQLDTLLGSIPDGAS